MRGSVQVITLTAYEAAIGLLTGLCRRSQREQRPCSTNLLIWSKPRLPHYPVSRNSDDWRGRSTCKRHRRSISFADEVGAPAGAPRGTWGSIWCFVPRQRNSATNLLQCQFERLVPLIEVVFAMKRVFNDEHATAKRAKPDEPRHYPAPPSSRLEIPCSIPAD